MLAPRRLNPQHPPAVILNSPKNVSEGAHHVIQVAGNVPERGQPFKSPDPEGGPDPYPQTFHEFPYSSSLIQGGPEGWKIRVLQTAVIHSTSLSGPPGIDRRHCPLGGTLNHSIEVAATIPLHRASLTAFSLSVEIPACHIPESSEQESLLAFQRTCLPLSLLVP